MGMYFVKDWYCQKYGKSKYVEPDTWEVMNWNITDLNPSYIWLYKNGQTTEAYYSNGTNQQVLDKTTKTWSAKSWNISELYGYSIWHIGDLYFSSQRQTGSYSKGVHKRLNSSTGQWTNITWNGQSNFSGETVWTDGDNIYWSGLNNSNENSDNILDISSDTWNIKSWRGWTQYTGLKLVGNINNLWFMDGDVYYSNNGNNYKLNKSENKWDIVYWNGLTNFQGIQVWTDGTSVFRSFGNASTQYVLNKSTNTWIKKTWKNLPSRLTGGYIWTDGEEIYYSDVSDHLQYHLVKNT